MSEQPVGTQRISKEPEVALNLLRGVVEAISSEFGLDGIAQKVATLVTEAVEADVCFVHLVDQEKRRVRLIGATPPFDELRGTIELALGDGVAGWVAESGEIAVVPDKWSDPRYHYMPELKGEDFSSLVSVPMMRVGTGVVGVINVHWKKQRTASPADVSALKDVASLFAGAVDHASLLARLEKREQDLSHFAAGTIEAQEAERRRIAADLHDSISQGLLSLLFHLDAALGAGANDPEMFEEEILVARGIAQDTIEDIKGTISALRPGVLDDLGLVAGLESLARTIPSVEVEVDAMDVQLEPHVETALFRICQESLQNILKHSGADAATIKIRQWEDEFTMSISDNGVGFDTALPKNHGAYGLLGMRERSELIGAKLSVISKIGVGTRITVRIPNNSANLVDGQETS